MRFTVFILIFLTGISSTLKAADAVFEQDYSAMKPGSDAVPAYDTNRSSNFPGSLPTIEKGFSIVKATESFQAKICEEGLKLTDTAEKPDGSAEFMLNLPKCPANVTFEISLKLTDFIKGKTEPNIFFIYAAGINLFFRSDRKDLRCYSMESKNYDRISSIKNDTWYDIKAVMRFNPEGKNYFDLYLNGKELMKNAEMRFNVRELSNIRLIMNSKAQQQPAPSVIIKFIKVY